MRVEAQFSGEGLSLFDHFIDASPDPAFVIDCQGRVLVWNRAIEALTGISAGEIAGQGNYAHGKALYGKRRPILADIMLHPELEFSAAYGKIIWHEQGRSAETENESGHTGRYLWAKASLLKDAHGKTFGVLETIRDISSLKRAERQLMDSERRILRLTRNMSDLVCELDIFGRYMFASDSCGRILGYEPRELLGTIFLTHVHPQDRSQVMFCYECVINGFEHPALVIRLQHKSRGYIWLEAVASPIVEADGQISGIVASLRDYSDRFEADKRRRLADTVYSNMNEGVYITDGKGDILDINQAGCRLIGYEYEEIIGSNMLDYNAGELPAGPPGKQQRLDALPDHWQGDIEVSRKNGDILVVGASIVRIHHGPRGETGYVTVFIDKTEQIRFRHEQEALREQMARVKRIASLSAMSAGIVHEIAQPLNAIKLVADGLLFWQKRGRVFETEQILEKINIISQQVLRISDIINHIRSFAGMSQAREARLFSINDAFAGAMLIMGSQLANHEIEVIQEQDGDLPPVVGDQHRLEEVFINLLANAMYELDEVEQHPRQILFRSWHNKGRVMVSVGDNGRGIPESQLEKIFEPFFSTKHNSENMGLGLAIVQSVIASFEGNIVAKNQAAGGAVFTIDLPAARKARERQA